MTTETIVKDVAELNAPAPLASDAPVNGPPLISDGGADKPIPVDAQLAEFDASATVEDVADLYTRVMGKIRDARALESAMKTVLICWMKANGQDRIAWANGPDSEFILYLGHSKSTKCVNVPKACDELLKVCEGDWERFTNCLSSGAIKHGTVKKLLKEKDQMKLYDELFVEEVKDKLESGEEKPKELQAFDTKFVK